MKNILTPMKMIPSFKDYLWGGSRLATEFGKNTPMRPLAESWEISTHPDGPSKIGSGAFVGAELREVLKKHPEMIKQGYNGELPILIKLIDAKESLSIQVHPDNAYALKEENQLGKNEMWYVIDALPDSRLIIGFKENVSKEEIKARIANNTILDVVNYIPVKTGDCFEIPAGMLHAIGEGVLIAEVQQSSNVTYRVYDFDRRDANGNARELHIDKAVDVTRPELRTKNCRDNPKVEKIGYEEVQLTEWDWFSSKELNIKAGAVLNANGESFHGLVVTEGKLSLVYGEESLSLSKGDSVFVPAGAGEYELVGAGRVIVTTI